MVLAAAVVVASIAWAFLFLLPRDGLWTRTFLIAAGMIAASAVLLALDDRLDTVTGPITPTEFAIGLGAGVGWLVATRIGHLVFCRISPSFMAQVQDLYRIRAGERPPRIAAAVIAMGIAEEVLFRGVIQGGAGLVAGIAVYTLVQGVERKWALALAALVGGVVTGVLFEWRDGLIAPATAHVLWTGTLTLVWPLKDCRDAELWPSDLTAGTDTGAETGSNTPASG